MNVSIIVPTYNEENNIGDCLSSLTQQDYPRNRYEVIVVDGCSEDRTKDIVKSFKGVRLFLNEKRHIASNRNLGLEKARFDFVAFTDADCIAPRNWLRILADSYRRYKEHNISGVGGANIAPGNSPDFAKAILLAQKTFLGNLGSAQGRQFKRASYVDNIPTCNLLCDKSKVLEVGGFSEDMENCGEDLDLCYKIRLKGYKLVFLPDSFVFHKFRSKALPFFLNMYNYGKARSRIMKKYPKMMHPRNLLPFIFLVAMALTALWFVNAVFLLPLLYFPFIFAYSFYTSSSERKTNLIFKVNMVFILQHFGYALGGFMGLL